MDIGKHLRVVRKAHGLLQKDLSSQAGLHSNYVSNLERGLAAPSFSTLSKIAKVYQLSVPHLLSFGNEESYVLDIDAAMDALKTLKYNMVKIELNIKPL